MPPARPSRKARATPWARSARRQRLWMAAFVLVLAVLAWGAYTLRQDMRHAAEDFVAEAVEARVQHILIEGARQTKAGALRTAIGLSRGDSLVSYDTGAARKRLEALPWVRLAAVSRQLPETLRVVLYEYTPVARLEKDGEIWAVSGDGRALAPVATAAASLAHLPLVRGEGAAEVAAVLLGLLSGQPMLAERLKVAEYVGARRWTLTFQSGAEALLPEENPARALAWLVRLDAERDVLAMAGARIDLRLADRIVLRLPEEE